LCGGYDDQFPGDIALVPYGYHGPAVAAPGYDLYYLNVMAGPDPERVWNIRDDPAHSWVRSTWNGQSADPRLPYLARAADEPRGEER
jgi:5-deoxy-glucuronate isomerase